MKPERIQDLLIEHSWKIHSGTVIEYKLALPSYAQVLERVLGLVTIARNFAVEPTFLAEPGELTVRLPWHDEKSEEIRGFAIAFSNDVPAAWRFVPRRQGAAEQP